MTHISSFFVIFICCPQLIPKFTLMNYRPCISWRRCSWG